MDPRVVAFYLPQFHPIPENDAWWGKGFTEWTNVVKARPLFPGHDQPQLPADLGFYDLRLRETRREQIRLAKAHGVDGFCYHYYWFSGKRLLSQPLDDMLADPGSDMPFCLSWANENWTRKWDGAEQQILIEQKYRPEDDLGFIRSVAPFLRDPRYIRVEGKPLLIVYRPQSLPDPKRTTAAWREFCRAEGLGEIHLCAALIRGNEDYVEYGFDSGVEFPPHNVYVGNVNSRVRFHAPFRGSVVPYADIARSLLSRSRPDRDVFMTVFPSWDNTARVGDRAFVVKDASPANYEFWLSESLRLTQEHFPGRDRLVFVNAWNEWAEGCHLEPDRRHGAGWLEATLRAKTGRCAPKGFEAAGAVAPESVRSLREDLSFLVKYHAARPIGPVRSWFNRHPKVKGLVRRTASRLLP